MKALSTRSILQKIFVGAITLQTLVIGGCAYQAPIVPLNTVPSVVSGPVKIQAVGYGSPGMFNSSYTVSQSKLMAMRAAKVDAYRALAEQVYGYRITGSTSVQAFATQNDSVRTYVDAFIRGSRLISINAISDGNYEATVELDLPIAFFDCITRKMTASGCVAPTAVSSGYIGYTSGI